MIPCECLDGGHDTGTGLCMCGGEIDDPLAKERREHANKLRLCLEESDIILGELQAAQARIETLTAERDGAFRWRDKIADMAREQEAQVETLTRERDKAREFAVEKQTSLVSQWQRQAEAAEARVVELEEALGKILLPKNAARFEQQIARDALRKGEGK